jgi:2-hydroxychromene-2-carboxylate isomerase
MGIKQKLRGLAVNALLSDSTQRAWQGYHDVKRRVKGETRTIELYYQVDDPYSHLLAQIVPRLMQRHQRDWVFRLTPPLSPDVDADPVLRKKWAARDARELATRFDLTFPTGQDVPDPKPTQRGNQILLERREFGAQLEAALQVGNSLWGKDKAMLDATQGKFGFESSGNIAPVTQLNYARMRKLGYYAGGSLYYNGEWYPLHRVQHLEQRLAEEDGVTHPESVIAERPPSERPSEALAAADAALELEMFFSFRSPYSYLALDGAAALADKHGIPLRIRPVLPMVTRGLPVPTIKRLYIVRDCKREAMRLGIPFGTICDPLGVGVERCLAAFRAADSAGLALEFTRSAARGIWSEALDPATYADMRTICDRAGLAWDVVKDAIGGEEWRAMVEDNAAGLLEAGLWGVPTFRVGTYSAWGQDRLDAVDDRLRRHFLAIDR